MQSKSDVIHFYQGREPDTFLKCSGKFGYFFSISTVSVPKSGTKFYLAIPKCTKVHTVIANIMFYDVKLFRSDSCLTRLRTRHFSEFFWKFRFFFYFDCGQKQDKVLFCHLKTTTPKCTKVDTIIANIMVYQAKQFRSDSCLTRAGMRHL